MVEPQPSKLMTRVRFPSPAPKIEDCSEYSLSLVKRLNRAHVAQW